jgi:hypothetical protein
MINGVVSGVDIRDAFRALGLFGNFRFEDISRVTVTSSEVEVVSVDRDDAGVFELFTTRFPVRWGDDQHQHAVVAS